MPKSGVVRLRRYVRGLADVQASDRDLLRRFVDHHDERAFETLVRRHDRLVRSAVAKVLSNAPDAEDAYQATFLVLVRRAQTIDWRSGLGPWLYGVAHRVAVKARGRRTKYANRNGRSRSDPSILPADLSWQEACHLLHGELDRLPDKYRVPLLLCYLEGKTREEAAAVLGVTSGTVRGRVRRGLDVLRQRLARRGVALSVGLLAALAAPSGISAAVTSSAVLAAVRGMGSASVNTLAQEVIMGSVFSKLGKVLTVVVVSISLTAGFLAAVREAQTRPTEAKPQAVAETKPQPAPKTTGRGILLLARESDLVSLSLDGKQGAQLSAPADARTTHQGRLSPSGDYAAFVVNAGKPRLPGDDLEAPWPFQVAIRKLGDADSKLVDLPGYGVELTWAPDGKRLAVTRFNKDRSADNMLLDPQTGNTEPLNLPTGVCILDWSPDGKMFLVSYRKDKKYRLGLIEKGANDIQELTELKVRFAHNAGRFSPDGKKVLFTDADPEQKDAYKWHRSSQPHVLDLVTKKRQALAEFPENGQCLGVAWSPDGKQIAYTWTQLHADFLKRDVIRFGDEAIPTEAFLVVADADGKNARTVTSDRSNQALNPIYGSIDWR